MRVGYRRPRGGPHRDGRRPDRSDRYTFIVLPEVSSGCRARIQLRRSCGIVVDTDSAADCDRPRRLDAGGGDEDASLGPLVVLAQQLGQLSEAGCALIDGHWSQLPKSISGLPHTESSSGIPLAGGGGAAFRDASPSSVWTRSRRSAPGSTRRYGRPGSRDHAVLCSRWRRMVGLNACSRRRLLRGGCGNGGGPCRWQTSVRPAG